MRRSTRADNRRRRAIDCRARTHRAGQGPRHFTRRQDLFDTDRLLDFSEGIEGGVLAVLGGDMREVCARPAAFLHESPHTHREFRQWRHAHVGGDDMFQRGIDGRYRTHRIARDVLLLDAYRECHAIKSRAYRQHRIVKRQRCGAGTAGDMTHRKARQAGIAERDRRDGVALAGKKAVIAVCDVSNVEQARINAGVFDGEPHGVARQICQTFVGKLAEAMHADADDNNLIHARHHAHPADETSNRLRRCHHHGARL